MLEDKIWKPVFLMKAESQKLERIEELEGKFLY